MLFLAPIIGACPTFGAITVTDVDFEYSQNFNSLPSTGTSLTWTNNSTISGWYRHYDGSTAPPGRDASVQTTGASNSGVGTEDGFLNVGQNETSNRTLVMRRANSFTGAVGVVFQNNSGAQLTGFSVGYTGEQWRRHGDDATSLYFEYAVVSSHNAAEFSVLSDYTWTRVNALEFVSPQIGGGNTGLNGNLAANRQVISPTMVLADIQDGEFLAIRWFQDRTNVAGETSLARHALGVENMSFSAIPEPSTYAMILGFLGLTIAALRRKRRISSN